MFLFQDIVFLVSGYSVPVLELSGPVLTECVSDLNYLFFLKTCNINNGMGIWGNIGEINLKLMIIKLTDLF